MAEEGTVEAVLEQVYLVEPRNLFAASLSRALSLSLALYAARSRGTGAGQDLASSSVGNIGSMLRQTALYSFAGDRVASVNAGARAEKLRACERSARLVEVDLFEGIERNGKAATH